LRLLSLIPIFFFLLPIFYFSFPSTTFFLCFFFFSLIHYTSPNLSKNADIDKIMCNRRFKFVPRKGSSVATKDSHLFFPCYCQASKKISNVFSLIYATCTLRPCFGDLHSAFVYCKMGTAWWLQSGFNTEDGRKHHMAINTRMKIDNSQFAGAFLDSFLQQFHLDTIKAHMILPQKQSGNYQDCSADSH
jgi:hypothetical protein